MEHNLKDYNATSRLKAAAITAANALHNGIPEAIYKVALLCESNTLKPGEEAINDLANAAADWIAAEITYLRNIHVIENDYPPGARAVSEYASIEYIENISAAEIKPLRPFIVSCADAARDFVAALQVVTAGALTDKSYLKALKGVEKAGAFADSVAKSIIGAQEKHDNAEMNKLIKDLTEAAMRYTTAAAVLMASVLTAKIKNNTV